MKRQRNRISHPLLFLGLGRAVSADELGPDRANSFDPWVLGFARADLPKRREWRPRLVSQRNHLCVTKRQKLVPDFGG